MLSYDRRVTLLALAAGFPAVLVSLLLLWLGGYSWLVRTTAGLLIIGAWLVVAIALREDDFSIRARVAEPNDALGQVMLEINTLAETLRTQRLGAQEATVLLRAV